MELTNTNDENSFDPTPRLKSSPIPINFVPFNICGKKCFSCGEYYIKTHYLDQNYCKKCLLNYLTNIIDNNIYLDVYVYARNLECNEHEISRLKDPQNIQECCKNCLDILYFKQILDEDGVKNMDILDSYKIARDSILESEKYCRLCGKLYQGNDNMLKFKLCSDCYLISSGYVESALTKKPNIPIIYLPWWYNKSSCGACNKSLIFSSDCQKYCKNCFIFYTGCRYCLTTNVIFGLTIQSKCKKCKRVSSIINIANIWSGNSELDEFLLNLLPVIQNIYKIDEFIDKIKNTDYFLPSEINSTIDRSYNTQLEKLMDQSEMLMEWIPYSQFKNIQKVAEGGFSIIYQAILYNGSYNETIILKKFKNSQDFSKYFLNELKSNQHCYEIKHHIIRIYGVTKDKLGDYMLVMQYASGGDLHNWLQKNFRGITWNKQKLAILWQISEGLETIHNSDFIHRDFHSGNILSRLSGMNRLRRRGEESSIKKSHQWQIGDLGLSQPSNNTSSNNEIYGVIPYIAPEIFRGSGFTKESDVYCMGMIMWELTTEDTPECYASLMKSCWDPDPKKRLSMTEIRKTFGKWFFKNKNIEPFNQAEMKRLELISLKKLGPEFSEKPHPSAIYTSRSLKSFISKCSSKYSSKDYASLEFDFDIDIVESKSSLLGIKRNIEESNINTSRNNGKKFV
ncbi:kinase-like domain-containing protein [Rhizophagus diaphanus]|nr:kinase-like domain-containing protein [Rhizophagus diaphanus] [Rhizophagus sp. MUCL 43196]